MAVGVSAGQRQESLFGIHAIGLFGDALDDYLDEHVDVLFGMGTSILLSARAAIPSVVVCNEQHDYFDDVFVYLHGSTGASLGWQVHQIEEMGLTPKSLTEILDELQDPKRRAEIGRADREYVHATHSVGSAVSAFQDAIAGSSLTVGQFRDAVDRLPQGKLKSINLGPVGKYETYRCVDKTWKIMSANPEAIRLLGHAQQPLLDAAQSPGEAVAKVSLVHDCLTLRDRVWFSARQGLRGAPGAHRRRNRRPDCTIREKCRAR